MKNTFLFTTGLLGAALAFSNLAPHLKAAESSPPHYVAHEWGTFTSVQGADGIQMGWNPFTVWDLPDFVYDQYRPDGRTNIALAARLLAKQKLMALQRMETPVIYFYGDEAMTVDVRVEFPQGTMTEWYPQASAYGARAKQPGAFLHWSDVGLLAAEPRQADRAALPGDGSRNHYYAARATDANLLRVPGQGPNGPVEEYEGFLFYRGVGQFQAPLTVSMTPDETHLMLSNTGESPLAHLFMVEIRQNQGRFMALGDLAAGKGSKAVLTEAEEMSVPELQKKLGDEVADALVSAGLYEKEARAMVATWRDSWFGEDGLRVLYLLPQAWTDEILPLTLVPAPEGLVRVMVGRAEMLTPSMEWEFLRQAVQYSDASNALEKERAVQAVQALGLGRFAQPLGLRILGSHPNPEFRRAAWALLQSANPPVPQTPEPVKLTHR
jgi:hypothetical protein